MLQRLIALLLGVLGLASIGLGVASATAWRADDPLVATVTLPADQRLAVADPGVLGLGGDPVTVTVRAAGSPVVLAVGRDTDVAGWVGQDAHVRLTGLSGWHTIATSSVDATTPEPSGEATDQGAADDPAAGDDATAADDPAAGDDATAADDPAAGDDAPAGTPAPDATADPAAPAVADPTGSDLWVAEADGDGSASLEWPAQAGRWSLVAASLGDATPTVQLSWPRTVTTPWLWPGVVLGVLLLAVAAILAVRLWRAAREEDDPQWQVVTTGMIAVVPGPTGTTAAGDAPPASAPPLMTRRQLREAEAAAAAARRGRGGRTPTGTVPVVAPPTAPVPVVTVPGDATTAAQTATQPAATSAGPASPGSVDGAVPPAGAKDSLPGPDGTGRAASPVTTTVPDPGPQDPVDPDVPAAGGSRADAWRRTWGIAEQSRSAEQPAAPGDGVESAAGPADPDRTGATGDEPGDAEPGSSPRKEDER